MQATQLSFQISSAEQDSEYKIEHFPQREDCQRYDTESSTKSNLQIVYYCLLTSLCVLLAGKA